MLNRITALSISHELFIFFKFKEHLPYVLPACLSIGTIAKYSKELIYILLSVRGKSLAYAVWGCTPSCTRPSSADWVARRALDSQTVF